MDGTVPVSHGLSEFSARSQVSTFSGHGVVVGRIAVQYLAIRISAAPARPGQSAIVDQSERFVTSAASGSQQSGRPDRREADGVVDDPGADHTD